jgi:hypothetical protein
MTTFRKASLFDGFDQATGRSYFAESHPRITDPDERARLLRFLEQSGYPLRRAAGLVEDEVDPAKGDVVPMVTITDGVWIWERAQAYYLKTYGFCPESEFYDYIKSQNYEVSEPDAQTITAALEYLYEVDRPQQD